MDAGNRGAGGAGISYEKYRFREGTVVFVLSKQSTKRWRIRDRSKAGAPDTFIKEEINESSPHAREVEDQRLGSIHFSSGTYG